MGEDQKYEMTDVCRHALFRYLDKGIPPGGFLTAVICNDLLSAVSHADEWNLELIPQYVKYLYNEAPGNCWGSTEAMQTWMEKFK